MSQITQKDRKAIIIGGGVVICYILFFFIAQPIYDKQKKMSRQIQDKILFIQKYLEILKQESYYEAKSVENKSIGTALNQRFYKDNKPAIAAASQQSLLEELARKTGVNIVRVRVDKPKYIEKLLTISTQITIRSKLRDLTHFIHMIENDKKFMIIEKMLGQRTNNSDLEELQTQLTVSGFIKKMKKENTKTI